MRKSTFAAIALLLLCLVVAGTGAFPTTVTEALGSGESTEASQSDTVTISRAEYESLLKYQELLEVQTLLENYYYQELDETSLIEGAEAGMLSSIGDPYTFFYTPKNFAKLYEEASGEYAGVGMMISANYETGDCTIIRVFSNSPAMDAGVLRGDILRKVNDMDVTAENLTEAVEIIRGEIGTPVTVVFQRGEEEISMDIVRAKVEAEYVNSCMLENQVGYISLYEFTGKCSDQFEKQARELIAEGARGLIIDLRDNPGGDVSDGLNIADLFLGAGTLTTMRYRDGSEETLYTTDSDDDITIPVVILVNENSASCSELFSGAMQDMGRAVIVGVNSYGKGIVQWVVGVGTKGAGMQMTVAEYFTPLGNKVHKVGINPDVIAEMPEEEISKMFTVGDLTDTQLHKAYDTMLSILDGTAELGETEGNEGQN